MEPAQTRRQSPPWTWIAFMWIAVALFDATQTVLSMRAEGMHHNWGSLFITMLLSWAPWAMATPVILRLGIQHPPVHIRPLSSWLIHVAACAAIGVVSAGWIALLEVALNPWAKAAPDSFAHLWLYKFSNGFLLFVILYASVLMVSYAAHATAKVALREAEAARLNEQLSKAQLDALRRQIEPHFLFNALNAITGLVREKKSDDAVNMIAALSDFLRRTLDNSSRQQVPLGEEMDFVEKYLAIQKVRFGNRLLVDVAVPSKLLSAQVPSLILQPMVENAIKHGISKRAHGGTVRISALHDDGMLTLRVYNDGPGLNGDWEQAQHGVGMSNVRTRLRSLYGEKYCLSMADRDPEGVEVAISFPLKEQ